VLVECLLQHFTSGAVGLEAIYVRLRWVDDRADLGESVTTAYQNLATNLYSSVNLDCRQP
jgi:hypothetical protein